MTNFKLHLHISKYEFESVSGKLFRGCRSVRQHRDLNIVNGTILERVTVTQSRKNIWMAYAARVR